jgi:hypothetical protein
MGQKVASIRAEVDPKIYLDLKEWAKKQEGRSTRRHGSILIEQATKLWRQGPDALMKMGSVEILRALDLVR